MTEDGAAAGSPERGARVLGLPEELWALACYVPLCGVGGLVSLGALLTIARRRPRIGFHAWQGLFLALAGAAAAIGPWLLGYGLEMAGLPWPGAVVVALQLAAGTALLVASVWMMATAYHRRGAALPLVGALARRWSGYAAS